MSALSGVKINNRKLKRSRASEEIDEHPLGKPPDTAANNSGSNLKRAKISNPETTFKSGDRVRCLATRFGTKYTRELKQKFCHGTVQHQTKAGCYVVKLDDGSTLESSHTHLDRTTVSARVLKRKRN